MQGGAGAGRHLHLQPAGARTGRQLIAPPARVERSIAAHGHAHWIALHRRVVVVVVVGAAVGHRIEGPAVHVRIGAHPRVQLVAAQVVVVVVRAGRLCVHLTEEAGRRGLATAAATTAASAAAV